ncbi:MAG: hypothetical protein FWG42_04080 [Clostridiales bacterium]|nr:hypothetical protein [Clostridiales bacterium]
MSNVPLDSLFTMSYGTNLELNRLTEHAQGINFVSRNRNNNGVVAKVKPIDGTTANPAGSISVALGSSSALYAFLQDSEYYSGRDVAYLTPKVTMNAQQKLYYCACLTSNRYKYNYGRQANKSLGSISVPEMGDIPKWVSAVVIRDLSDYRKKRVDEDPPYYSVDTWHEFTYDDIFEITRGDSCYMKYSGSGVYPYVSASDSNNGVITGINGL